jgi:hypothetical protein
MVGPACNMAPPDCPWWALPTTYSRRWRHRTFWIFQGLCLTTPTTHAILTTMLPRREEIKEVLTKDAGRLQDDHLRDYDYPYWDFFDR